MKTSNVVSECVLVDRLLPSNGSLFHVTLPERVNLLTVTVPLGFRTETDPRSRMGDGLFITQNDLAPGPSTTVTLRLCD